MYLTVPCSDRAKPIIEEKHIRLHMLIRFETHQSDLSTQTKVPPLVNIEYHIKMLPCTLTRTPVQFHAGHRRRSLTRPSLRPSSHSSSTPIHLKYKTPPTPVFYSPILLSPPLTSSNTILTHPPTTSPTPLLPDLYPHQTQPFPILYSVLPVLASRPLAPPTVPTHQPHLPSLSPLPPPSAHVQHPLCSQHAPLTTHHALQRIPGFTNPYPTPPIKPPTTQRNLRGQEGGW